MIAKQAWIFVDDDRDSALSFADRLEATGLLSLMVSTPKEARDLLLNEGYAAAGVLMDVDLSNIQGEMGTGPGIAQDIRTKQKGREAREFPIVRFSAADPWAKNIKGDPSSDDLFELSIIKDDLKIDLADVVRQLHSLQSLYSVLIEFFADSGNPELYLEKLFGIDKDRIASWVHDGLVAKVLIGIKHAPHVSASAFCKSFLIPTGLLVDELTLALRLGIDINTSGEEWSSLKLALNGFKYTGICSEGFNRWWSRGLEEWWFSSVESSQPLSSRNAEERVLLIKKAHGYENLRPLRSALDQSNTRYWRVCRLASEKRPSEFIPVDPADAVRMTSQVDLPSWVEPHSASPRLAFQSRDDARLNYKDLDRLRKKYKVA